MAGEKMSEAFTADTLPEAVKALLEMNNYEVRGPLHVHGAEVDLVATHKSDPLAATTYVEVTIEYVDNDKYGKDVGKLALLERKDPGCRRLIISAKGFSAPVRERAEVIGIRTFTYDELFTKFQQFAPYVDHWLGSGEAASDLAHLVTLYEPPAFHDTHGRGDAVGFLDSWRGETKGKNSWLIVVGEYGTGKTALSRVLHHKWLTEYRHNPSLPIPFRLELRDFTRQFDARSLLHHFLDHNQLSALSIDFVEHLLRSGRVLLILDGYDEMAQYMHARERRACLEALAALSAGGAKGILTSRPNYFSEAEEFQLFEILYRSLERGGLYVGDDTRRALDRERELDSLLESHFVDRYERVLADLTEEQTEALVRRSLADDIEGQNAVLGVLRRVLRSKNDGSAVSLSGKPVIVTYLLEVVNSLKENSQDNDAISEWRIYNLIVDNLMLRDLNRTPDILPAKRRAFLQSLAIWLSEKGHQVIQEEDFRDLVENAFQVELRRAGDRRRQELDRLFADLRTSATLTRGASGSRDGWRFSHNSLREYLCAEAILQRLESDSLVEAAIPISDAMRSFAASLGNERIDAMLRALAKRWGGGTSRRALGQALNLLWDGAYRVAVGAHIPQAVIAAVTDSRLDLNDVVLGRIVFSSPHTPVRLERISFARAQLTAVSFANAELHNINLDEAVLDGVDFSGASLFDTSLRGVVMMDVNFSATDVVGADFIGTSPSDVSIVIDGEQYAGKDALGYLAYRGANVDHIPNAYVYQHHPKYGIVEKILLRLSEQAVRQVRGLTQRGTARVDPAFARAFLVHLENKGIVQERRGEQVSPTPYGRDIIARFIQSEEVPEVISDFLDRNA